ncbi:hypothetical protein FA15DRAFT_760737 [Coprinopsis marcescibilis]|uniref:Fido domain-containing protein n=1 Tax=Coprinopsis marcescibilis TaxID=230819 RepID=A0A5C3KE63_COPMA|nr:hypothetical protein FA15DRAFT_760737 [Coprinopsis marcescibilis]
MPTLPTFSASLLLLLHAAGVLSSPSPNFVFKPHSVHLNQPLESGVSHHPGQQGSQRTKRECRFRLDMEEAKSFQSRFSRQRKSQTRIEDEPWIIIPVNFHIITANDTVEGGYVSLAIGGASAVVKPGELSSAIARPQFLAHYAPHEATGTRLATEMAYGTIMNHPFADGNKHTAFLAANEYLRELGHKPFVDAPAENIAHDASPSWRPSDELTTTSLATLSPPSSSGKSTPML